MAFFSALFLFFGSYFYLIGPLKSLSFPLFMAGLAGLWALGFWRYLNRPVLLVGSKVISLTMVVFLQVALVSALASRDADIALGAIYLFLLYFSGVQAMQDAKTAENMLKAFFLSTTTIVVWSLLSNLPVSGISYQGIFENPNAMGGILATLAAVMAAMISNAKGSKRFVYIGVFLFVVALVVLTRSRGALASVIVCMAAGLVMWAPKLLRSRSSRRQFVAALILVLMVVYFAWPTVVTPMIEKITYKEEVIGDISDGRFSLWWSYLSEATLIGGGRAALADHDLAAHNTFISLIAQYGWVTGLLFLTVVLGLTWLSWRNRRSGYIRYLPFFACLVFLTLSMTEGMMLKSPMFAMFLFAPAIYRSEPDPQYTGLPHTKVP